MAKISIDFYPHSEQSNGQCPGITCALNTRRCSAVNYQATEGPYDSNEAGRVTYLYDPIYSSCAICPIQRQTEDPRFNTPANGTGNLLVSDETD